MPEDLHALKDKIIDPTLKKLAEQMLRQAENTLKTENEKLKECPFCGGVAKLIVSDDEGNIRDEDYENNPWSGLSFKIEHVQDQNKGCPIASYRHEEGGTLGVYLYDSRKEAITAWNTRYVHMEK